MKFLRKTLVCVGFAFFGAFGMWFYFQLTSSDSQYNAVDFVELLNQTTTEIPADNFACEIEGRTVATVLASRGFFQLNSNRISKTHFSCTSGECILEVSNCKPWQSSECGQTFLKYEINGQRKIIPSSFSCLDVP